MALSLPSTESPVRQILKDIFVKHQPSNESICIPVLDGLTCSYADFFNFMYKNVIVYIFGKLIY